jgi:hypothetical protein
MAKRNRWILVTMKRLGRRTGEIILLLLINKGQAKTKHKNKFLKEIVA